MVKLNLTRSLRKSLKQGHPWVYKEAFEIKKNNKREISDFAQLYDSKGLVTNGIYDSTSVLGFRALGFNPFNKEQLQLKLQLNFNLRSSLFDFSKTNAFRLLNGEGDGFSGLVCDVYSDTAVIQYDGEGMKHFWSQVKVPEALLETVPFVKTVVFKERDPKKDLELLSGEPLKSSSIVFKENGVVFETDLNKSQKTGFFLDQRDNREHLRRFAKDKTLLNVFSYTGGFSVYAGLGGAKKVFSLDVSKGACDQAQKNWELNGLSADAHESLCCDAYEYLETSGDSFDLVVVDPPSMASSSQQKPQAIEKYISAFQKAALLVKPGGGLFLSSCSSQISFEDFHFIVQTALSRAKLKGKVVRLSGQGGDHTFPQACHELRYLKFIHICLE